MKSENRVSILSYLIYPLTLVFVVSGFFLLLHFGAALFVACYLPPSLAAVVVLVAERKLPYRNEWQPDRHDLANDLVFMFFVQILLPVFLSFFIAHWLLVNLPQQQLYLLSLWPHTWPVFAQAILMLLIVDFFRYWLHRANHNFMPLWRLHAVHHSPPKLYWINTGRFHPIEKALQFLIDSFPFILAGVSPQVLGLYFLLYSTNGFFQHCNADLRLGSLNYLVSGPELHRWHHSKLIEESNSNYGSSLIIWDILFGTYLNPGAKSVAQLGLLTSNYPQDFISQLTTPFKSEALSLTRKRDK